MKLKNKYFIIPAAALAALAASPLAAGAAEEVTTCTSGWCYDECTNNCEDTDWYEDGTNNCEGSDWYEDGTTNSFVGTNWGIFWFNYIWGDADCDGRLQVADAVLTARFIAEDDFVDLTMQGRYNADCNGDNMIDANDLVLILSSLACSDPVPTTPPGFTVTGESGTTTTATDYTTWDAYCCTTADDWGYGSISIFNIDMSEEQCMRDFGIHAPKTVYQVGEELDLSNMILDGGGYCRGCYWDYFPLENPEYLTDHLNRIEVDASEFDNTQPGTYTIYLHQIDSGNDSSFPADGSFKVTVVPEKYEGTACTEDAETVITTTTTTVGYAEPETGDLWVDDNGDWKSEYRIGEALDIMNARLYGCGTTRYLNSAGGYDEGYWDWFGEYTIGECIENGVLAIDTSEFDNTKPGTYHIYMRHTSASQPAEGTITVKVIAD